jgi:hypothetical protein
VRVAAHHLVGDVLEDLPQPESSPLLGDVGVEDDLQQKVPELVGHGGAL